MTNTPDTRPTVSPIEGYEFKPEEPVDSSQKIVGFNADFVV